MNYTEQMLKVFDMARFYYNNLGHAAGGILHIVLDDENTEKEFIEWCKAEAIKTEDYFAAALANELLKLTQHEVEEICCRHELYSINAGYMK